MAPTSVLLPTAYGQVNVSEVRQIEIDKPSDDPGDRWHAVAHAWASDTATEVTIEVAPLSGAHVEVSTLAAEPGPLVAVKLQAIMNRTADKQVTNLQDIARIILAEHARPAALAQLASCDTSAAADITLHVDLWMVDRRRKSLRWIHDAGGTDLSAPARPWLWPDASSSEFPLALPWCRAAQDWQPAETHAPTDGMLLRLGLRPEMEVSVIGPHRHDEVIREALEPLWPNGCGATRSSPLTGLSGRDTSPPWL